MRTLVMLLLLVFSSTAIAQPPPPRGVDRREKIKQRIRALRAYTLTEQLQLDEATAAKLFPALQKYDEEFDKLLAARADIQRRLEASESITDPKQLDKLIDEAVANQRALWDTEEKRLVQLRKILTPAQTARVLVVLPAMERKIQTQLRKAVQQPRGRGAPPSDELTKNPFESTRLGDPSDDDILPEERAPGRHRQRGRPRGEPAPAPRGQQPCDPFRSMTGCK